MKKKLLLCLFIITMFFIMTGCVNKSVEVSNSTENDNSNEEEKNTSSDLDDEIELYSDSSKIVFQNGNAKLVYYYSGDKITKYESYLDYQSSTAAKYALSILEKDGDIKKAYTDGRYLIIEYDESVYEDLTTTDVRTVYSYLKEVKKDN